MRLIDLNKIPHRAFRGDRDELVDALFSAPTIDAVPVVRCKDCLHYNNSRDFYDDDVCELMYYCDGTHRTACEQDYCSYGKRRSDTDD